MSKSFYAKPDTIEQAWHVVDAAGVPIGRLATRVAQVLRGKHKPTFTPSADCGDFVIVVNAAKAKWTGNSKGDELLYRHSQHPGGLKSISRGRMLEEQPERLIERVVWGMLPKNALGRKTIKKLKVYAGPEHPHMAQEPKTMEIKNGKGD